MAGKWPKVVEKWTKSGQKLSEKWSKSLTTWFINVPLDTLLIMGNKTEFEKAVKLVLHHVNFDKPHTVQVFEANIRVLGGLLSAHLLLEDQKFFKMAPDWYMGDLLTLGK